MGHGHVRDGRLGGLFHGLLRGVGGSGEENGGLHGAGVLTGCYLTGIARLQCEIARATCANPTRARTGRRARDGSPEARGIALTSTVGLPPKLAKKTACARAVDVPEASRRGAAQEDYYNHDTTLTTQLGRRNEEGPLLHEAPVFRPLGRHRRVHFF